MLGNKFYGLRVKTKSFVSNRFSLAKQVLSGISKRQTHTHTYLNTTTVIKRNAEVCLVRIQFIHISIHLWRRVFK